MTQNSIKLSWSAEEVDEKLKSIMKNIHEACVQYGTEADGYVNYVKGANVAGFMKVAKAMMAQGIVYKTIPLLLSIFAVQGAGKTIFRTFLF